MSLSGMPRSCIKNTLSLITSVILVGAFVSPAIAQEKPTIVVLRLEAELSAQNRADTVSLVLTQVLNEVTKLKVQDQSDVTMSDLLLIYECETDTPECLEQAAESFGSDQVLYGKVEPFADEVMVILRHYSRESQKLRPVYSRKIPDGELQEILTSDLRAVIGDGSWKPPAYLSVSTRDIDGAKIFVDGHLTGKSPMTQQRVASGEHVVKVEAADHQSWENTVNMVSGKPTDLEISLIPTKQTPSLDPKEPEEIETIQVYEPPIMGWVVLGVAGLTASGGIITGLFALQAEEEFAEELRERQASNIKAKGERLALTSTVLFATSGVAVVSAGLLLAFAGDWEEVPADRVSLAPALVDGGGGLQLMLRF